MKVKRAARMLLHLDNFKLGFAMNRKSEEELLFQISDFFKKMRLLVDDPL